MDSSGSLRKWGRRLVRVFAVLMAVYLLLTAVVWGLALYREHQVRAAWAGMGRPIDSPVARDEGWHPSAAYVETVSGLWRELLAGHPSPAPSSDHGFRLFPALEAFTAEGLDLPEAPRCTDRAAVESFLDERVGAIETLSAVIESYGGPPESQFWCPPWWVSPEEIEAPRAQVGMPPPMEELQILLFAFALRQSDLGQWGPALRSLEALRLLDERALGYGMGGWGLNRVARWRIKEARLLLRCPDLPPEWEARLTVGPLRESLALFKQDQASALLGPQYTWTSLAETSVGFYPVPVPFEVPLRRGPLGIGAARLLRAYLAENVRRGLLLQPPYPWVAETPESFWPSGQSGDYLDGWSCFHAFVFWAFYSDLAVDAIEVAWLELNQELTRKVAQTRRARAANGGQWPDRLPEAEVCDCCPGERWVYTKGADGSMSIRFARELEYPGAWREIPRLEYHEGPERQQS